MTISTAKKVQLSSDNTTFYTLPGDTGDLQLNATDIKDTVFGQVYESGQTGLIDWTLSANGMYKGFAGYVAKINLGGTPTTLTTDACTLVSGKTYQITNAAHQWLDINTAVSVFDNAVNQTANVQSIDYLFGNITFKSAYTPTGPVTVTGKYLPMTQIAKAQSFTLTQTAATIDQTDFPTAQGNGGYKVNEYGLKTVSLDLSGFYSVTNGWKTALIARTNLYIEVNPDGSEGAAARGIFKCLTEGQSGKVGDLEMETVKFTLQVPDPGNFPLLLAPFTWQFASGNTLNTAIVEAITNWEAGGTGLYMNYLWDGTNGQSGQGTVTDVSLTGGLDVMNTFAIKLAGSGALTTVGTG